MSTEPVQSTLYSIYNYNDINDFVSVEEEEEISAEPSPPAFSSPVPETHQSSLEVSDLTLMNKSSSATHFKAQELENSVVLLEFESQDESKLGLSHTLLMLRNWPAQAYSLNLRRSLYS